MMFGSDCHTCGDGPKAVAGQAWVMDLGTPLRLGGTHYLTAVSVGRDPDDETVWDCPVCGGHGYADEWPLVASVRDTATSRTATYRYCDDACLRGWLRTAV